MKVDQLSFRTRATLVALSFVLVGIVGYIDGATSAHIAFSIFYVIPVCLAAWCGNRVTGLLAAVTSALAGLAADVLGAGAAPVYTYVNLVCRLVLFVLAALLVSRNKEMMGREQAVAAREHDAATRLQELNDVKDELMRSVAMDARVPLGDIYARIVTLGFDMTTLTTSETREVLNEVADASRRLSALVDNLLPADRIQPSEPAHETEAAPTGPGVGAAR